MDPAARRSPRRRQRLRGGVAACVDDRELRRGFEAGRRFGGRGRCLRARQCCAMRGHQHRQHQRHGRWPRTRSRRHALPPASLTPASTLSILSQQASSSARYSLLHATHDRGDSRVVARTGRRRTGTTSYARSPLARGGSDDPDHVAIVRVVSGCVRGDACDGERQGGGGIAPA